MSRQSSTHVTTWISFFLVVSVWNCSRGTSAPSSQVSKSFPQALLDTELNWDLRLGSTEGNANSSSFAATLSGSWRAAEESSSWPALTLGWRTIVAMILGAIAASLSSAGGIGGGALYVPIFNLLLEFDSKTSAALSSFMIFGGTLINLLWYIIQKHPQDCDKPLLDYDVALVFQPNVLLGISVGVLCNVMSPAWLVTALLIVILSYMTFHSCSSACRRWNSESSMERIFVQRPEEHDRVSIDGVYGLKLPDQIVSQISWSDGKEDDKNGLQQPLLKSLPQTCSQFPVAKIAMLALIWLCFVAVHLVEGIADAQNLWNIEDCGLSYWLITLSQLPLAVILTAGIITYFRKYAKPLEDCDIVNARSLSLLPVLALSAGLIGGMLGLGGGMIISPLLMEVGMHPQVTAATCNFMVFFSSSLSVIQYWFLGRIPMAWGLYSAAVSTVFSVIGLQLVQRVIGRFGRASVIQFVYSVVIGISAILMAVFGSLDVWKDIQAGDYMGFISPC